MTLTADGPRPGVSLSPVVLVLIGTFIAAPRFAFIAASVHFEGDSFTYATVAENILVNFCVSMSDPAGGTCVPHWGGNQLPGYPAFVALVWSGTGKILAAPLIAQTLVTAIVGAYLVQSILKAGYGRQAAWLVAGVVAFSPSLMGWSRTFLTESLAIAVSLWVFAEILRSISESRLRVWPLGVALAVGLFVRYDLLIMAIPVAAVAFAIHRPRPAVLNLTAVAVMILVPYGAWTVRSVAAGLPALPPFGVTTSGHVVPPGVLSWIGTWLDDQALLPQTVWAVATRNYEAFKPPPAAFREAVGGAQAEDAVRRLGPYQSQDVPADLDDEFAAMAQAAKATDPLRHWIALPARRAASLWASPYPGLGWPSTISTADRADIRQALAGGPIAGLAHILRNYPGAVLTKGIVTGYRYASVLLIVVLFVVSLRRGFRGARTVIAVALLYAFLRTLLLSQTVLIETRYLVTSFAWIDVALAIAVSEVLLRRRRPNAPVQATPPAAAPTR